MHKRSLTSFLVLTLILSFALSACSGAPIAALSILPQSAVTGQQSTTKNLAIGILKMEGTSQAVTATQASTLLPLWKAVNAMGNDKSASKLEVAALYDQIQESLTADQVAMIKQVTYTQPELANMIQKYGSTSTGKSSSASKTATSSSQGGGAGGPSDMGGGPMGDISSVGNASSTSSQTASSAKTSNTSSSSSDINPTFASAIVTLFKKRASLE